MKKIKNPWDPVNRHLDEHLYKGIPGAFGFLCQGIMLDYPVSQTKILFFNNPQLFILIYVILIELF